MDQTMEDHTTTPEATLRVSKSPTDETVLIQSLQRRTRDNEVQPVPKRYAVPGPERQVLNSVSDSPSRQIALIRYRDRR